MEKNQYENWALFSRKQMTHYLSTKKSLIPITFIICTQVNILHIGADIRNKCIKLCESLICIVITLFKEEKT